MEAGVTLVAIEVPRAPQVIPGREVRSMGEWAAGRHELLRRWVRMALTLTDAQSIRLITGQPDQAVFDLVADFGVLESLLSDWIAVLADRATSAGQDDAVVFIRGASAMASADPIRRALEAMRSARDIDTVEPAVMPVQEPLHALGVLGGASQGPIPWHRLLSPSPDAATIASMGFTVPVFEVRRLKSLASPAGIRPGGNSKSQGFVWVEEQQVAMTDDPLGLLRAEWICSQYGV
jgi:hypothetical protein